MSKRKQIFSGIVIIILIILIFYSRKQDRQISWFPSYAVKHKIPLGTYILFHETQDIFKDQLIPIDKSPYILLNHSNDRNANYVLYNSDLNFGKTNLNALLQWVEKGNNLFLFSRNLDKKLLDTLHIDLFPYYGFKYSDSLQTSISNHIFSTKNKLFKLSYIILKDSIHPNIKILGNFNKDKDKINFIQVRKGKGYIYIHSFPQVLTNFFILQNQNYLYDEKLLNLMNTEGKIYWDTHYQNGAKDRGVFKILKQTPAFAWAYRFIFIGIFLFIFFQSKRKQRPIPVLEPPKNETISFTKTIAEMYLENKEHDEMANLRIRLFYDWLKKYAQIIVNEPVDKVTIEKIAQKTKSSPDDVFRVFDMIAYLRQVNIIRAKDVLKLEKLIEKIKK